MFDLEYVIPLDSWVGQSRLRTGLDAYYKRWVEYLVEENATDTTYLLVGASEDRFNALVHNRIPVLDFFMEAETGMAYKVVRPVAQDRVAKHAYIESLPACDIADHFTNLPGPGSYLNAVTIL